MAKAGTAEVRPYHHGNLRRVLLDAALEEIAADGPNAMSLRGIARHAGVSHAAPAHHFGDKAGVLTAIATEGFTLLGDAVRAAHEDGGFLEIGLAYIQFSIDHPAHFEVMFRRDLYRADDPDVVAAEEVTTRLLYEPAQERFPDASSLLVGIAGWAFVHGFASLWANGNLPPDLGDDPIAAAGAVARLLFTAPPR